MIKRFGGVILGVALVFGAIGATSLTAQAQYQRNGSWDRNRDWRRDDDDRRWRQNRKRQNERLHGRGYNNGRYGYPGNNNGRYGNGRYNNGRYDNYGNYGSNNYELNRGYQQGLSTGSSDARRGQSYSPQRSRYYRNPSSQAFLEGFVRGYDQGYRQYAGYNNGYYRNNNGSIWSQILGLP
jgi:hypothetical protein